MSPSSSSRVSTTTTTTTTTKASTSASAPSSESASVSAPSSESASIITKEVTPTSTCSTIIRSLSILDPVLQFLTRASGQTLIPFQNLKKTIPSLPKAVPFKDFVHLIKSGILIIQTQALASAVQTAQSQQKTSNDDDDDDYEKEKEHQSQEEYISSLSNNSNWEDEFESRWNDDEIRIAATNTTVDGGLSSSSSSGGGGSESGNRLLNFHIGFPSGDTNKKLCGSTKTAAKRRLAALKRCLKEEEKRNKQQQQQQQQKKDKDKEEDNIEKEATTNFNKNNATTAPTKDWTLPSAASNNDNDDEGDKEEEEPILLKVEQQARKAFQDVLGLKYSNNNNNNNNKSRDGSSSSSSNNKKVDIYAPYSSSSGSYSAKLSSSSSPLFERTPIPTIVLPRQLSYAGTHPAQTAEYEEEYDADIGNALVTVTPTISTKYFLLPIIKDAFGLDGGKNRKNSSHRLLYRHQAMAIKSALVDDRHTLVCTGTGSGKSLCFLIPVIQRAITTGQKSLLLFPTKALAQDQFVKLQTIIETFPELTTTKYGIMAATLDGDTPHSQRSLIASTCNVIFTNPDTLHASILPNWKTIYKELLQDLKYVVIDEAHMYEGVFGAHVAMILARLYRIHCAVVGCTKTSTETKTTCTDIDEESKDEDQDDNDDEGNGSDDQEPYELPSNYTAFNSPSPSPSSSSLVFLACSATLAHPEHHFRLLCCIPSTQPVTVLTDDFSPRAAKHFFVWNPTLLDANGKSLGYVSWPKKKKNNKKKDNSKKKKGGIIISERTIKESPIVEPSTKSSIIGKNQFDGPVELSSISSEIEEKNNASKNRKNIRRRHSADETALLLAAAMSQGVRCIAFCKTRCLVEWVYDKCIKVLKQSPDTAKLISKLDSYRGGYSKMKRREIESKLFHNQLLGVVGTSALELGVDIGGVGLTLHCGFPSSHASLMQQAGRAGRGAAASHRPSLAICVCFNSPVDQHLWRHPASLLSRGLSAPLSMPIYPGLVQGHLICAGNEFPLTGRFNVSAIQSVEVKSVGGLLSDEELFGSKEVYLEALENLTSKDSLYKENKIAVFGGESISVFKTHPSIQNPWTTVSIRSIETVNYDIVDISHPMQGNRMGGCHHEAAIMDNIPYSRVFYHAFPGAIITHRGQRYKIVSMTRPPAFGVGYCSTVTLGAYAKPSTHRYYTRPLSSLKITVVKQMERVDLFDNRATTNESNPTPPDPFAVFADELDPSSGSFAGCGVITVKRNVHGYKKMSLVTGDELSRSELSLPDMEYDTGAFWIDCDASGLGRSMTPLGFGYGVHALSHALCNVAPLFVPCVLNDIQCDHSFINPTRVVIFDSRAGGSGITAQLWKFVFIPGGLLEAAIDLLDTCPSCSEDVGYTGGCPACIQAGECIKFNDFLCKSSALIIAKHMLQRIQKTEIYRRNEKDQLNESSVDDTSVSTMPTTKKGTESIASPRREKRKRAMRSAMDNNSARQRQLVIGRPSWPMDISDGTPRQQQEG